MLKPGNLWQESFHLAYPPQHGPGTHECYQYFLGGDTLLNDTTYQLLRRTGHTNYPSNASFNGTLFAFVREDTSARKVFIRLPADAGELLMYDFSVGLGPYPWTYPLPWEDEQLMIVSIDTIMAEDGPHRRLNGEFGIYFIEGIGATTGFVGTQSPAPYIGGPTGLGCLRTDDITVFQWVNDPSCSCGTMLDIAPSLQRPLFVGPSPTTDQCRVSNAAPYTLVRLLTMDGRVLQTGICSGDGSMYVDMTGRPAALYMIEVLASDQRMVAKIIKE